ncbi:MAG TPA: hypothetical protein PKW98_03095 [Candidatus Wallbacteria bacterium]|nr:MAG: hypothetical protein BWY32_02585 [bacterium ADurb.Bin243]HOD40042.1 hypothetical protein [Candidatus Wallbacteria bacterium]HPG56782.1 hypothetical protein [Candidatus Wallbacteria bacterium]
MNLSQISKRFSNKGFMDGFAGKIFTTGFVFGLIIWAILRFAVTYDADMIKKRIAKLDGEAVLLSGQAIEWRYFDELKIQGVGYNVINLKTRKGNILVATLKDAPTLKSKYFIEAEIIGSIETVNKRFKLIRPLGKDAAINKNLPFLLEKTRISLPFTI